MALIDKESLKANIIKMLGISGEEYLLPAERAILNVINEEPPEDKYEYHYDHTDCIWYHNNRSKCPVTCAQYRDGWNDAMQYIYKGGKGYKPFKKRGEAE